MAIYQTDGKKLLDVEYDVEVEVGDMVDGMRVLSVNKRSAEEVGVFLLEPFGSVICYVFDEVFIIGRSSSYDSLLEAVEAWNSEEI